MTMRVTFQAAHREAVAALSTASERLLELQRQVSTGKRVLRPGDDASAASTAAVERANLAVMEGLRRMIAGPPPPGRFHFPT